MKKTNRGPSLRPIPVAVLTGLALFQVAAALSFINPILAIPPLLAFLLLVATAPFIYRLPFFLPILTHGNRASNAVSLTFDDGPDPETHRNLLQLLKRKNVSATFFVVGSKAERHPDLIRDALDSGHSFGNHTYSHDPLTAFRGTSFLSGEVRGCQSVLERHGIRPRMFRPVAGVTWPGLWITLLKCGLECVTFTVRAGDSGNRWVRGISARILKRIRTGDIVLLHDCLPRKPYSVEDWLNEVEQLIDGIHSRGLRIVPLEYLLNRPVMDVSPTDDSLPASVRIFYDGLADSYDREQKLTSMAVARNAELDTFKNEVIPLFSQEAVILEIGAGTGRFSLELARHVREVTALDASPRMIERLLEKSGKAGITNVETHVSDFFNFTTEATYDGICAFTCLEYERDLKGLINHYGAMLKPGGYFVFTLARTGFFRFFAQIGNATRQGIWLCGRTRGDIMSAIDGAGLRLEKLKPIGSVTGLDRGLIWYGVLQRPVHSPTIAADSDTAATFSETDE